MSALIIKSNPASPEILAGRARSMKQVEDICRSQTQWYECETPAHYRRKRLEGLDGFMKPALYDDARVVSAPARDGHLIELRIIQPSNVTNGVLLHFHAGGFVIGSAKSYDSYLLHLAKSLGLIAVSVEYRLAPENPYPRGHHDCIDAALYALSAEGEGALGGSLRILAGESAGGSLAVAVALALRDEYGVDVRSRIAALMPSYAIFDLTYTPSLLSHEREAVLSKDGMKRFVEAAFSSIPFAHRKDPKISTLYADLRALPPALFLSGTEDALVDDSIFMATKWNQAGNETELCLIPGAWHAFTLIPAGQVTDEGLEEIIRFGKKHL